MKFQLESTRDRKLSAPSVSVSIEKGEQPPQKIGNEMFQERYVLKSEAYVSFFSNQAQLPFKRQQAEVSLRGFMYLEAMPLVDRLILMAETSEAREVACALKDVLLGKQQE